METLQVDSNILLTMISINMTIIGLTVCLSFAIYYFFGFILRENNSVKRLIYLQEEPTHNKEIPQTYRPRAL